MSMNTKSNRDNGFSRLHRNRPRTWAFIVLFPVLFITLFIAPLAYVWGVLKDCPRVFSNLWGDLCSMFGHPFRKVFHECRAAWAQVLIGFCGGVKESEVEYDGV